jgi:catechol 2,3-dioxygenase-like lactoylglutathione lyase family enzyme
MAAFLLRRGADGASVSLIDLKEAAMSTTEDRSSDASGATSDGVVDMKLEVVTIPVADVDRAKEFYMRLGWRLDVTPPTVAQLTPPGSGCSVQFGPNRTSAAPGSAQNSYLIVSDLEAARVHLQAAGIDAGEVFHLGPDGPRSGPDPEHRSYFSLFSVHDPDGNSWLFQEITTRLPGRVDAAATSFGSARDLADAMRRASVAHGEHEKRIGAADQNWPDWYAEYMVAEQAGTELPK